MAELKGKKRMQPSSCPEGWGPAAMALQLELTRRQGALRTTLRGHSTLHLQPYGGQRPGRPGLRSLAHAP